MAIANIPGWSTLTHSERALAVIDWCDQNRIDVASIYHSHLAIAMDEWEKSMVDERREMGEEYELVASPMDYVHIIRAIAAFLRARA